MGESILLAAERLCEAAGHGNNTAVGYHFGSTADLLRKVFT